ncbi:hypothetical protein GCM10011316_31080 [Roseibium aquae]|uniref:HTH cro/C1-type domain-containing protein n=1 Tax=Roseibium aquae TaxID=1323746 RepID=A0A916TM91_9HYPH|nr:helix-turn-helix transcriptional regulator [Roseibium aquae]GGB56726.1 hypothetical protein GCM10011316_31080 [Roseibium aquae]
MNDWRGKVRAIVKRKGFSLREVSLRMGRSEGYLKVLLARENDPGVDTLSKLCKVLAVPVSSVIDDVPENPEALEFARCFEKLTDDQRTAIKTIMEAMAAGNQT